MSFRAQCIASTILFMLIAPTLVLLAATAQPNPAATPPSDVFVISGFTSDSLLVVDARTGATLHHIKDGHLDGPLGMTLAPNRRELLVCSELTGSVERYSADTWEHVGPLVQRDAGGLAKPCSITISPNGASILVSDFDASAVLEYDARTGAYRRAAVEPKAAGLRGPDVGMAFADDGALLVPSFWTHELIKFDPRKTAGATTVAREEDGLKNPRTVLAHPEGGYLLSNEGAPSVTRFNDKHEPQGAFIADDPATPEDETGGLTSPSGMAWGPDGALYVTDVNRSAVLKYNADTGAYLGTFLPDNAEGLQAPTFIILIPAR